MSTAFILSFGDGRRIETRGNGIVGRSPGVYTVTTELDDPSAAELVAVDDDSLSVSRAHLAFGQFEGAFWVADLGSANGTSIAYPGDGVFDCEPFTRYEVDAGSVVRFGRLWFAVLAAQDRPLDPVL